MIYNNLEKLINKKIKKIKKNFENSVYSFLKKNNIGYGIIYNKLENFILKVISISEIINLDRIYFNNKKENFIKYNDFIVLESLKKINNDVYILNTNLYIRYRDFDSDEFEESRKYFFEDKNLNKIVNKFKEIDNNEEKFEFLCNEIYEYFKNKIIVKDDSFEEYKKIISEEMKDIFSYIDLFLKRKFDNKEYSDVKRYLRILFTIITELKDIDLSKRLDELMKLMDDKKKNIIKNLISIFYRYIEDENPKKHINKLSDVIDKLRRIEADKRIIDELESKYKSLYKNIKNKKIKNRKIILDELFEKQYSKSILNKIKIYLDKLKELDPLSSKDYNSKLLDFKKNVEFEKKYIKIFIEFRSNLSYLEILKLIKKKLLDYGFSQKEIKKLSDNFF